MGVRIESCGKGVVTILCLMRERESESAGGRDEVVELGESRSRRAVCTRPLPPRVDGARGVAPRPRLEVLRLEIEVSLPCAVREARLEEAWVEEGFPFSSV